MKRFKKVISVLLVFALVFTSMITFTAKTTDAKVKSIKVAKKATIVVGKKKTFKIKIKTTGKTSKKFTVKMSKKKIVKVKKKKKKIIVTALKPGKVTLTIRSKANKKKKKKIKITVKSNDATLNVTQRFADVYTFAFSKKVNFSQNNLTVLSKKLKSGKFIKTEKVYDVNTSDQKNYTVVLDDEPANGTLLQFTVKGVNKSNIVKEVEVYEAPRRRTSTQVFTLLNTERFERTFYASNIINGNGRFKNASGLPAGISATAKDGNVKLQGTISRTGVYNSYLYFEDEKDTVYTLRITFVVGSNKQLAVYVPKRTGSVVKGKRSFSGYSYIYVSGGSGSYSFSITDMASIFSSYTYSYYGTREWYFNTDTPGTYRGKFTVTDNNDPNIKVSGQAEVEAKTAAAVTGKVTTKSGKGVYEAYVFANSTLDREFDYAEDTYADANGAYTLYLAPGTFDFGAYAGTASAFAFNRSISGNTTINFALDVYQVTMKTNSTQVPAYAIDDWYNNEDDYVGYGEKLYLKPGSYNLTATGMLFPSSYKATANFTVSGDMTVTANVTVTGVQEIKTGSNNINTDSNWKYFKFVAPSSGYYVFESSNNSGDPKAYLYDNDGDEIDYNDDYSSNLNFKVGGELTAGETYYLAVKDLDGDGNSCSVYVATMI